MSALHSVLGPILEPEVATQALKEATPVPPPTRTEREADVREVTRRVNTLCDSVQNILQRCHP